LSGQKLLTLTLAKPDLVAILNTADGEQSVYNTLTLDASRSYDPDDETTVLSFRWTCTDSSGNNCVDIYGDVIFSDAAITESSQTIPENSLVAYTTYNFSVEVFDDSRTSSKSAAITTVGEEAPALQIADYTVRVSSSKPYRIETQVNATSEVTYAW